MRRSSGRGTWASAFAIATLLAAPAGAGDDDEEQSSLKLSVQDQAIVQCMVDGNVKCSGKTQHEPDPKLWPTGQEWLWTTEMKWFSLPALSGPSAGEVFRHYATQASPGTFSQGAGSTPP